MKYYKPLKEIIEDVLRDNITARNNDRFLMVYVYQRILKAKYGDTQISYVRLLHLPPQSSIKRIRAMIQNDDQKYLPTYDEVARRRLWDNEKWKKRAGVDQLFPVTEDMEKTKL